MGNSAGKTAPSAGGTRSSSRPKGAGPEGADEGPEGPEGRQEDEGLEGHEGPEGHEETDGSVEEAAQVRVREGTSRRGAEADRWVQVRIT